MSVSTTVKKYGIEQAIKFMYKDPEKNLPKLMDWADTFCKGRFPGQRAAIRRAIEDPTYPYYDFIRHMMNEVDHDVLTTIVVNFFINANMVGVEKQEKLREEHNCNIPWAILLDPTSACNLHCTGCWAAEYGNKLNLTFDEIDDIIRQGKDMGVYMYIYTGGEPLVRKADLIKLCEKHDDCIFLAFTNGTLIDEKFADDMLRVKNFVPAISLEGFEEATDSRRGDGVYGKATHAMNLLRERKLLYGISSCYTRANFESITSEEYYDSLIRMGAYFIWYFHYMPVGNDASPELLPTPEQRTEVYRRIRRYRAEKPLFAMDFQNDAEFVGGCIAGGRTYLHINANGDVDPLRVHPLFRLEHPREDAARDDEIPCSSWPTTMDSRSTTTCSGPARCSKKPGEAARYGKVLRRAFHGSAVPRDCRSPLRQVRPVCRRVEAHSG